MILLRGQGGQGGPPRSGNAEGGGRPAGKGSSRGGPHTIEKHVGATKLGKPQKKQEGENQPGTQIQGVQTHFPGGGGFWNKKIEKGKKAKVITKNLAVGEKALKKEKKQKQRRGKRKKKKKGKAAAVSG